MSEFDVPGEDQSLPKKDRPGLRTLNGRLISGMSGFFRRDVSLNNPNRQAEFRKKLHKISTMPTGESLGPKELINSLRSNLSTEYIQSNLAYITRVIINKGFSEDISSLFGFLAESTDNEDMNIRSAALSAIPLFLNNFRVPPQRFEEARQILLDNIAKLGFDPKIIVPLWLEGISGGALWGENEHSSMIEDVLSHNLRVMSRLEAQYPGSCRVLNEDFGIYNFGRYPEEMLVEQFKCRDENRPYGVIAMPYSDHNGAFYQDQEVYLDLFNQMKGRYLIRAIEGGDIRTLVKRLINLDRRYGKLQGEQGHKIAFGILAGHGSSDVIELGREGRFADTAIPFMSNFKEIFADEWLPKGSAKQSSQNNNRIITVRDLYKNVVSTLLNNIFVPEAPLVLDSCSTGDEGNRFMGRLQKPIAQVLAERAGASRLNVIASARVSSLRKIGVSFKENGHPIFDVEFQEAEHRREFQQK